MRQIRKRGRKKYLETKGREMKFNREKKVIQSLKDLAGTYEINEYTDEILSCVKGNPKMRRW